MTVPASPTFIDFDDSVEALLRRHRTSGSAIYFVGSLITLLAAGAMAVPVDVTVRAPATLRPLVERQSLRALVDGTVGSSRAVRGAQVNAGDTLFMLVPASGDAQRGYARTTLREQLAFAAELEPLLALTDPIAFAALPRNTRLRTELAGLRVEWRSAGMRELQARRARDRLQGLAQRGFAAPAELELASAELATAEEARRLVLARQQAQWAELLTSTRQRIHELFRDTVQLAWQERAAIILSPVAGTIEEVAAPVKGGAVRAGDVMASISPSGSLEAEAFVSPRDIAHLRPGMSARLLIEGYDVQEWGSVRAIVATVADDFSLAGEQPVFRVALRPLASYVVGRDGRRMALRKGLRCQVRFLVGRRQLGQLLMRRGGEWLDPTVPTGR